MWLVAIILTVTTNLKIKTVKYLTISSNLKIDDDDDDGDSDDDNDNVSIVTTSYLKMGVELSYETSHLTHVVQTVGSFQLIVVKWVHHC
jgi:hypothetical protein